MKLVEEYAANERMMASAGACLNYLRRARPFASPAVVEHIDTAIAAAEGACAGYDYRDSELHDEAQRLGVWAQIMEAPR